MKDLMQINRFITYDQMMEQVKYSTINVEELKSNWFVSFEYTFLFGKTDNGYICVITDGDEGGILIDSTDPDNHQFYQIHRCIEIDIPMLVGALTEYYQFIIQCVIGSDEHE